MVITAIAKRIKYNAYEVLAPGVISRKWYMGTLNNIAKTKYMRIKCNSIKGIANIWQ